MDAQDGLELGQDIFGHAIREGGHEELIELSRRVGHFGFVWTSGCRGQSVESALMSLSDTLVDYYSDLRDATRERVADISVSQKSKMYLTHLGEDRKVGQRIRHFDQSNPRTTDPRGESRDQLPP